MLERFVNVNVFIYTLWGLGVLGVFLQMLASTYLRGVIKATKNIETTKKKALKIIRDRSKNSKSLGQRIRNSDAFVNKHMESFKLFGFSIENWLHTNKVIISGVVMVSSVAVVYYAGEGRAGTEAVNLFANGAFVCAFLYGIENIFLNKNKIGIMKASIKDYIENISGTSFNLGGMRSMASGETGNGSSPEEVSKAEIAADTIKDDLASARKGLAEAKKVDGTKNGIVVGDSQEDINNDELLENFLKGFFT